LFGKRDFGRNMMETTLDVRVAAVSGIMMAGVLA
jgi:hypothetical protein